MSQIPYYIIRSFCRGLILIPGVGGGSDGGGGGMGVRESYPAATGITLSRDVDENKYRRKNPLEMVSRWIKYVVCIKPHKV